MDRDALRREAEEGSCVAQAIMGLSYLYGVGMEIDHEQARRWLLAATEQGSSRAALNLADMHADALGGRQDLAEAQRLYEYAAERGEFLAQIALGRMYSRGTGGAAVDSAAARHWFAAAVAQEGSVGGCDLELGEAKAYLESHG